MGNRLVWGLFAAIAVLAGLIGYGLGVSGKNVAERPQQSVPVQAVTIDPVTPLRTEPTPPADGSLGYLGMSAVREDGSTAVCLRFTAAPDPDRVVSDKAYVRVEPDAPFSLQ
ncbi:MAG: hypothetical protein WBA35_12350, partial [Litorimonas sp.]